MGMRWMKKKLIQRNMLKEDKEDDVETRGANKGRN